MRRIGMGRIKLNRNRGETIVEVMVAFMVLLIVLAIFGNSILAAGEAQRYAIDTRREADQGMKHLQNKLYKNSGEANLTKKEDTTIPGVYAVQYTTQEGLTYWVYQNEVNTTE